MHKSFLSLVIFGALVACTRSSSLGDNFFLLEGDNINDRVIVFCTGESNKECYSGISIIPTYDRQFQNGKYLEYVKDAVSDNNWILARTVRRDKIYYWILNKTIRLDSGGITDIELMKYVESNLYGPYDLSTFKKKKEEFDINLEF